MTESLATRGRHRKVSQSVVERRLAGLADSPIHQLIHWDNQRVHPALRRYKCPSVANGSRAALHC